jgi:hypothetical protein
MNESKNRTDATTKDGRGCINSKHSNMIKHRQQPEIKQTRIISRRTVVAKEEEEKEYPFYSIKLFLKCGRRRRKRRQGSKSYSM